MLGIGNGLLQYAGLEQAQAHHLVCRGVEVERAGSVVEVVATLNVVLNLKLDVRQVGVQLAQKLCSGIVAIA